MPDKIENPDNFTLNMMEMKEKLDEKIDNFSKIVEKGKEVHQEIKSRYGHLLGKSSIGEFLEKEPDLYSDGDLKKIY